MASFCRYFRLCNHTKICLSYSKVEYHVASRSVGESSALNQSSRSKKVKPEVITRLHRILEDRTMYQETLFSPQTFKEVAVAGVGHSKQLAAAETPMISRVLKKTTSWNKDEVLSSHYARTLASISCFDKEALNLSLYELDAMAMNNVDITAPVYAFLSLLDLHWFSLMDSKVFEPRHAIQTMFFIGTVRNAPATLFQNLEDYFTINCDDLDITEWSLICNSFFASNRRISSADLLRKIASALLRDHRKCPLNLLGNFMKVFQHSGYDQFGFYMQLGDALAERRDLFRMNSLTTAAQILSLYSSVRIIHDALFDVILHGINHAVKLRHIKPRLTKDLCRICWAFTSLQEPIPHELLQILETELLANDGDYIWAFPETAVEILTTLALNDIYPRETITKVFSAEFLRFKQKRLLEQDFQLQLLEISSRLNLSDLRIKKFSDEFHERAQEKRPSLRSQIVRRTGLQPLIKGLLRELPDPSFISIHHILPHPKILDVELRFDEDGRPVQHPNGLKDESLLELLKGTGRPSGDHFSVMHRLGLLHGSLSGPISNFYSKADSSVRKRKGRRLVIKVYGWNQYTRNPTRLLGLHQHEVNLLNQLGYDVIGINPADASHLEDMPEEELSNYIQRFILKR